MQLVVISLELTMFNTGRLQADRWEEIPETFFYANHVTMDGKGQFVFGGDLQAGLFEEEKPSTPAIFQHRLVYHCRVSLHTVDDVCFWRLGTSTARC